MKISVTKTELLQILSVHFNMPVTDLVISKGHMRIVDHFIDKMTAEVGVRPTEHGFPPTQKINAIKALRVVTTGPGMHGGASMYGLAEAKWAIENWARFIKEFSRLGRVPKLGGTIFSVEGPTFS